jgi:ADP-ribose pyrophosphatase YjhB (NUDIX family)
MNKNACLNCGKIGHIYKNCDESIISYGIICFKILGVRNDEIENYLYNKFLEISEYNYSNLNRINLIPQFYNKIKILMVKRRNSLNYIDFIRGKYNITSIDQITKLFRLMTKSEIEKIKSEEFDTLWVDLWRETSRNKIYQKEYNISKNKFYELRKLNYYNIEDSEYIEPEWGFPKGRRNMNEKSIECAIREFTEETKLNNIILLERVNNITEEYLGTNLIKYKHIYYMGLSDDNNIDTTITNEISEIAWLTIPEAINKTRKYYNERIKLLHQIYFFILNIAVDIKDQIELII